jgi:hypothetical protein
MLLLLATVLLLLLSMLVTFIWLSLFPFRPKYRSRQPLSDSTNLHFAAHQAPCILPTGFNVHMQ